MKVRLLRKVLAVCITTSMVMASSGLVYADETEETLPSESVVEETEVQETETEPLAAETEETEETAPSEETIPSDETVATEASGEAYDEEEIEGSLGEPYVFDTSYDEDYLAEQFIAQEMSLGYQPLNRSYDYMSELTGYDAAIFYRLRPHVIAIANGIETSTVIEVPVAEFTPADLGLSNLNDRNLVENAVFNRVQYDLWDVFDALLNSCPYEMYWHDKTEGCSVRYKIDRSGGIAKLYFRFSFVVAEEYMWGSDYYSVDPRYGESVRQAASNARSIVNQYAVLSDVDKLAAYRDAICNLVDYNDYAAYYSDYIPYGNPWQMIWVFDGDPSTEVVCEGYSKAFQYLCDNSTFRCNDIYAITVSGDMRGPNGSGAHMWNVVHMDDGRNYLVDVTNCDGSGRNLFLRGMSGTNTSGYTLNQYGLFYGYDNDVISYYSPSALLISSSDYNPYSVVPQPATVSMHRLYNPNSGEHFYTANTGERDMLIGAGWSYEGIGWVAPARSNTPVYRLYNANGGEHHYTTSVAERNMLISLGWSDEGIGWYSDDNHGVPVYRQYNPNAFANNHNYTTSLSENNWLVSIGWQAEGIGWYGIG